MNPQLSHSMDPEKFLAIKKSQVHTPLSMSVWTIAMIGQIGPETPHHSKMGGII